MTDSYASQLVDRTVLVVGGGTGIGAACARSFANEGCRVAVSGRREEPLRTVVEEFATSNPDAPRMSFHTADVADRESVNELFQWGERELGRIDVLINSAGINIPNRAWDELTPDDWDRLITINATGAYNCMHAALPAMRKRGDGLVVNISSVAGMRTGELGGAAYNASKFAMAALGRTVANEVRNDGVRITTVYPGEVDTPILENRPEPVSDEHRASILQAEDVATAILMLALLPPRAHVSELVIKPTSQAMS